jgi:hypothetical protein
MKKITSALVLFFSVSLAVAQSSCTTAVTVMLNSTTTAPAFTAENGAAPTQLCGLTGGTGAKGKWYKFVATQNINVTVSTYLSQNNNSDTRLIVYSGDCSSLVCVDANDDYNGGYSSQVTFAAITGTTYTFAFDNRYSSAGFDFTVMEATPAGPDRLSFTSTAVAGVVVGNYTSNCIVDM